MSIKVCIWLQGRPYEREAAKILATSVKANWDVPAYTFETMTDLQSLSDDCETLVVLNPFSIIRGTKQETINAPFTATCPIAGIPLIGNDHKAYMYRELAPDYFDTLTAYAPRPLRGDFLVMRASWINEQPPAYGLSFIDDLNSRIKESLVIPENVANRADVLGHSIATVRTLIEQREKDFTAPVLCFAPVDLDISDNYPASLDIQFPWECYRYFVKLYGTSPEFLAVIDKKCNEKVTALFDIRRKVSRA